MRSIALLVSRLILGGYMIVHGARKLFGAFDGRDLEGTAGFLEGIGLQPGKQMAATSGACELGGGVLTATGLAYPLGPLVVAGTAAVASTTQRDNGVPASGGGLQLPLTNLAAAGALAAAGPGRLRVGSHLPRPVTALAGLLGAGAAGYAISRLRTRPPDTPDGSPSPPEASAGVAAGSPAGTGAAPDQAPTSSTDPGESSGSGASGEPSSGSIE